jgi:hypothetical protein
MRHAVNEKITEATASLRNEVAAGAVPGDLDEQIRQQLNDEPRLSWDEALAVIAERLTPLP